MAPPGEIVRGAPYSATAVSEVNQILGDGTKIHRQVAGGVYRDGQGRTRNEVAPGGHGLFAPPGHSEQLITITDPVAALPTCSIRPRRPPPKCPCIGEATEPA